MIHSGCAGKPRHKTPVLMKDVLCRRERGIGVTDDLLEGLGHLPRVSPPECAIYQSRGTG